MPILLTGSDVRGRPGKAATPSRSASQASALEQCGTVIGRDAEEDEDEAEHNVQRRRVDRLLVLFSRRPADPTSARAKDAARIDAARIDVSPRPDRPSIAEEEAGEKQEASDQVVPERDRTR